jgi:hypothetical protein
MKRIYTALASTALLAAIVVAGSAVCPSSSFSMMRNNWKSQNQVVNRSVIKVHTDRGVVTLPGRADSWDAVESAEFVADSLAELQVVNNQASVWPMSYE